MVKQEVAVVQKQCGAVGYAQTTMPLLQQAAGSEHGHPRLGRDLQGDTFIGRNEEHSAPPQRDIREGSDRGGCGVALDHQQDAGAVQRCHCVELHGGRDLRVTGRSVSISNSICNTSYCAKKCKSSNSIQKVTTLKCLNCAGWKGGARLMTHLYPNDSEVRHRGVVEEDAGVSGILHTREDLGGGGGGAVVQHLAQRVDVDVLGREASTHRVVRARHAFYTVCTPGTQGHMCG